MNPKDGEIAAALKKPCHMLMPDHKLTWCGKDPREGLTYKVKYDGRYKYEHNTCGDCWAAYLYRELSRYMELNQ